MEELFHGAPRKRVGLRPEGKAPAREGTAIMGKTGHVVGKVTSGGFGPSFNGPVAMGYVEASCSNIATPLRLIIRGAAHDAVVANLPFVAHRYAKGK